MNRRAVNWLLSELPDLVSRGIISQDNEAALRTHYGVSDTGTGRNTAVLIFSVLGAALIGLGIILLLASNWADLPRWSRTTLGLTPLMTAFFLALIVLRQYMDSRAWREGTAVFYTSAVAAAIAIVSQVYHLADGNSGSFLLTWMLLSLPLAYILAAVGPAMVFTAGITVWAMGGIDSGRLPFFWLLLLPLLPMFVNSLRRDRYDGDAHLLAWVGLPALIVIIVAMTAWAHGTDLWIPALAGAFSAVWLVGVVYFPDAATAGRRSFAVIGGLGTVLLSIILSCRWAWDGVDNQNLLWSGLAGATWTVWAVLGLLYAALVFLIWQMSRRRHIAAAWILGLSFLPALLSWAGLILDLPSLLPMLLFNAYLLILGIELIDNGLKRDNLGSINCGMLLVSALILLRFFDSELDFLIRGAAFVVLGTCFLLVNRFILRRKGGAF